VALIILMIFRPQGLIAAKNHLLTYSRQVGERLAALRAAGKPTEQRPPTTPPAAAQREGDDA